MGTVSVSPMKANIRPSLAQRFAIRGALFALASILVLPCDAAPKKSPATNPDLTKGEPLPEGKLHDWNLGATGGCSRKNWKRPKPGR